MPWDTLWAGWRSEYVSAPDDPDGCLFCRLPGGSDQETLIVGRGAESFITLNRYPYTTGHVMIAPYRHAAHPTELTANEQTDIWHLLDLAWRAIDETMHPDGYNMGANLGRVAGAGVPGHFHLHLVPRWSGDANFMTTIGGTRVVPEDLAITWQRIHDSLSR
jgi:ATP adenylyltransferase